MYERHKSLCRVEWQVAVEVGYISLRLQYGFFARTARPDHWQFPRQNGSLSPMHLAPIPAVMMLASAQLTHLAPVDVVILLMYFAMVIFIGFYVKGSTNTRSEEHTSELRHLGI